MISTTYRKIVIRQIIAIFLLLAFLLMYDVILDILLSGLSLFYDAIGAGSEELVQYLFHTNHRESEIVVIYLFTAIFLFVFYQFVRALPSLIRRTKRRILFRWKNKKSRIARYWQAFSSMQKVTMVAFYSVIVCLLVTWLFFL